jgi:integrase
MKGKLDDKKFRQLAERVTGEVIALSGDKALSAYTIHDAKAFRDALQARGAATMTVRRNFAVIRSI